MTAFTEWAGAVLIAASICTALHILVGNTGVGRVFRLMTTVFFLCAVLHPWLSGNGVSFSLPSFSVEEMNMRDWEAVTAEQLKSATEQQLLHTVNQALERYDLQAEKVEIRMDTSEGERISITDITVYIPAGNSLHPTWVKQIAEQRLGTEVTVRAVE